MNRQSYGKFLMCHPMIVIRPSVIPVRVPKVRVWHRVLSIRLGARFVWAISLVVRPYRLRQTSRAIRPNVVGDLLRPSLSVAKNLNCVLLICCRPRHIMFRLPWTPVLAGVTRVVCLRRATVRVPLLRFVVSRFRLRLFLVVRYEFSNFRHSGLVLL